MAERVQFPSVPSWLAALPFVFSRGSGSDRDMIVRSALASAAAAMAADSERRDCRSRISFLLAELASQFGRRTGDQSAWIPVTRGELARAAGIDLTKVKRIVGFLSLSAVIEAGTEGIRVTDWARLCKLGDYDPRWGSAEMPWEPEEDAVPAPVARQQALEPALTAAGDPASFV